MKRLKLGIIGAIFMLVFLNFFLLLLWSPPRQIELHQRHLLRAASRRDWVALAHFLDDAYTDRWGHDRAGAIADARPVLQSFFSLTISEESPSIASSRDEGTISEKLKFEGVGGAFSNDIQQAVNTLNAPFVFKWKRKSWKPWDWQLVHVDNADLRGDGGF